MASAAEFSLTASCDNAAQMRQLWSAVVYRLLGCVRRRS
jgi:hypothetical protein